MKRGHKIYLQHLFLFFLQVDNLSREWAAHADLPQHVVQMLNNFPETMHPMSQFSTAITAMNTESQFAKAYAQGVHKAKHWEVKSAMSCCLRNDLLTLSLILKISNM